MRLELEHRANQADAPEVGTEPLAVVTTWDPTLTLREYANRLAELNGITLVQLLGRPFTPSQWNEDDSTLRHLLARAAGLDPLLLDPRTARRGPPEYRSDSLLGRIDPGRGDHRLVAHLLAQSDPRTQQIYDTWTWSPDRRDRLHRLAQFVLPRLTVTWPPGLEKDREHRSLVLADDSRIRELRDWSPQVRAYALLTLWEHTGQDGHQPTTFCDYLTAERWTHAADHLATNWPDLARCLRAAATDWPPAHRPETPPRWTRSLGTHCSTGPFAVADLARWPLDVIGTVHAATVAAQALRRCVGSEDAWTLRALADAATDLSSPDRVHEGQLGPLSRFTRFTPPTFAGNAARLLATTAGHIVLNAVLDRSATTPAPLEPATAFAWWPIIGTTVDRQRLSAAGLGREQLRDVVWTDLTGHLARVPSDPSHELLASAARLLTAEDLLTVREQVLDALDWDTAAAVPAPAHDTTRQA